MALADHVPRLPRRPWGVLCFVLNLLPGLGTLVAAGYTRSTRQVVYGMIQFLLFWALFIPWAWSILWGSLMLVKSE